MNSKLPMPTGKINCQTCQAQLADYVRLELSGQAVEQSYPEVAFHIETCERCEAAYYREFRAQGERKSLAELQQIGQGFQVTRIMQQIAPPAELEPIIEPNPSWYEVALEHGRAWLEQETGRWRQLQLSLAALGNMLTPGESLQRAPALAGLMGVDETIPPVLGTMNIAPPDANFEVKVVVMTDPSVVDDSLCRVDVAVYLKDHFGDFSGLQVVLWWGDVAHKQETDTLGRISFMGLPRQQLPSMSLWVLLG